MKQTQYNGWTNYETWLLYSFMESTDIDYWYNHTSNAIQLAAELKESYTESIPDSIDSSSIWFAIITASLSEVNWYEIANHILNQ